jgi:hypothetical protein
MKSGGINIFITNEAQASEETKRGREQARSGYGKTKKSPSKLRGAATFNC